jgi:hypothetical protein
LDTLSSLFFNNLSFMNAAKRSGKKRT